MKSRRFHYVFCTKRLSFQNVNKNVKATQRNEWIKFQNNASQLCNNIPFRPLCSFNLFLKCWQSYFQSLSVWKKCCLRWTTRRFHFVVYYNDYELEPSKNTRNDVTTQKFRSRSCCRSEILTSLLVSDLLTFSEWEESDDQQLPHESKKENKQLVSSNFIAYFTYHSKSGFFYNFCWWKDQIY